MCGCKKKLGEIGFHDGTPESKIQKALMDHWSTPCFERVRAEREAVKQWKTEESEKIRLEEIDKQKREQEKRNKSLLRFLEGVTGLIDDPEKKAKSLQEYENLKTFLS
jgi:hypothetical protein